MKSMRIFGLIVVLIVLWSVFSSIVLASDTSEKLMESVSEEDVQTIVNVKSSNELAKYKVAHYTGQNRSLFGITEPNEVTNLSWVDRIHNEIHSDINISENEIDVVDITYDDVSITGKSDVTAFDANNNKIEDSLEFKASGENVLKIDVIVLYNQSVDLTVTDYSLIDAEIKYDYSVINATVISIPCNRLYELSTIQDVKMVYEDHKVQAYLDSSVPVIKADTARIAYNVTGSNVTIAVIDTGIDDAHESLDDMDDNLATSDPKIIGFKDFVNFYPDPYDDHGHGTHCAGIAAGTGGPSVYKGVAPGAKLVGVKVLNKWGSGRESTIIAGIDWAVQNKDDYGIKIISMSLGRDYNNDGTTPMALACDAAVDAGIVVSVAAGNAGMWGGKTVGDPACAKKVITVGAIDDYMDIAYFSSRGPTADGRTKPEVCAVGVDVTSAEADTGNGYVPHGGTSMSTPHVAGVAALMLEYNPNLAPLEIKEILMDTAVDRGIIGPDNNYGWGVVDAMFALPMAIPQEHDIKVSLLFIPEYIKINKSIPINSTIFNNGLNNETNITVQLLINGSIDATKTITSLDSGTNCSVNFTWTHYEEGSYNVSVHAVPVPGESVTINNLASRGINVLSNIYIIGYDTTHGGRPSSWYIDIIDDIKSEGFIVSDITSGPISLSLLNNYDAIWIDERGGSWSTNEKSALATYVENGGGLFVEGDELGDPTIVNVFNMSYSGIQGYYGESTDISMHSITRGVSSIYFSPVNSLNVYSPAIDVARDVAGNKMIGVRRYGNGKVVVISDEVLAYIYNADNGIFGRNIFRWITLPPQAHDIEVLIDAPSIVGINVSAQINATIANTGLNSETDVIIDLLVDGTKLGSKTIPLIQNGTDTTINFNWTPTAVGYYNVSVYAEPVPGEGYVVNNLATRYVEVPKAVLTDIYADYGIDLDSDGLYDYLAIDVGVNVAKADFYYLYGDIETLNGFCITDARNNTYLSIGKQNITLLFNGIDIHRVDLNGPYTLTNLRLRDNYWNTIDRRLKAYNTSSYDSKEFQLPTAVFTDVYNDSGIDTDDDTFHNYLSIGIGVNVSESGNYRWYAELYDSYGNSIAYEGNSAYLENGTQIIKLNFDGLMIRKHKADGPYYLKYLRLYGDDYVQQDSRHDAYVTSYYEYTDFQPPGAEFNDIYSDYGEDKDEDELYNYLVINVGVNVRDDGDYRISGSLYEKGTYNSVDYDSNMTYLNKGNQTVQLRFDGIKLRQNEYNGTYDLKYLRLYNVTYTYPVPQPIGHPPAKEVPPLEKSETKATGNTNNFTVLYGEEFDYRRYACTTNHYNYTEFQKPPAEFTSGFNDYGLDTTNNSLYDYLVIEKGIEVREAGNYKLYGSLRAPSGQWLDSDSNHTYLNEGLHNVTLKFYGPSIYLSGDSGNFDVDMDLYDRDNGRWLGRATDTTFYYSYTDFDKPPEFTGNFSDYGLDTNNDTLYNHLVIEAEINVTKAGEYELSGNLQYYDEEEGYWWGIDSDWNRTYLDAGIHNITLQFDGIRIYNTEHNGSFRTWLSLYETEEWKHIDKMEYFTNDYDWTDFQKPPAEFNDVYSDHGIDIDGDGLYNYLTIDVGVNVTKAGNYIVEGRLNDCHGGYIEWRNNYTYLNTGNQTVKLDFEGIKIRQNKVNGTFDLKYLYLYNTTDWTQLDYIYDAYTTPYYNYTDFQRLPAEFNEFYSDNGTDTDGGGLYNNLTLDIGVNVTTAGSYRVYGYLYDITGYQIDYESNTTYLSTGSQTVQLNFEGIKIRQNGVNGPYNLKYLYLYNSSTGVQFDYIEDAYITSYYNYTDFQTIPPCYTYTKEYVTYDWDGISTPDQNWTGCDDCSYNYVLPWNFTFFCENHSSIQISTNGLITFLPDTSSHCCSPHLENTEAIAPFWGDLSQSCGEETNISVQDKGDRVVVVWYTGTCGGGCLNKDLFEVILYENGTIRFNYNYLNNIPYSVGAGISNSILYYTNTQGAGTSVVYTQARPPVKCIDAASVLEMAVRGKWSAEADINQDGKVSSVDALMILQAEVSPLFGGKIR
ncbi:MAG: hypothetical protein AEth_01547 [Candidatus Argoarchaeum ethanivorans]|uniref:Dockerin domain-containing protein n=1 Tax=Candidatus Argoarchaeum ethanivorans TaxID=2608793 RepID=A0A8B3S134_9EURY|nr:MAG: hypothetical protein AEth_01547 [Candidatus Argoarchaeum ethanivorans]